MTDLDKAREWADSVSAGPATDRAHAAAKIIQSLPDQWVDAEKARALIASLNAWAEDADAERSHGRALGYRTAAENLATLLPAPSLPTLANMTQEEREACQWMQAKIYDDGFIGILTEFSEVKQTASYLCPGGETSSREYSVITPLPDLPKLQWPGNEVVETPALPEGMRLADHKTYGRVVVAPRASTHGEESFYMMNEDISWGASHGYRPTGEFNFLDGDQHA